MNHFAGFTDTESASNWDVTSFKEGKDLPSGTVVYRKFK